jgi:hypothetical protein
MSSADEPFILGLTMAGAISAGAYSAGVFDFFFQALEEWEKAKKAEADANVPEQECSVPNHSVVIPVISGASAGGITAALGILGVGAGPRQQDKRSPCVLPALYEAWVNRISFTHMLQGSDLERRLLSLLDSNIIEEEAAKLLSDAVQHFKEARPYLSRNLHLFLTITNLRGVPYQIKFRTGSGKKKEVGHVMTMHADRVHFRLEGYGRGNFKSEWLDAYRDEGILVTPQNLRDDEFREQFQAAAIGTGAFPIGLPARLIKRQTSDYNSRAWPYPVDSRRQLDNLRPQWPPRADEKKYDQVLYAGSDGGLIDNEPFELTHWTIMKSPAHPGAYNETSAEKADRAVLMIDPFPTPSSFDPDLSDGELKEQLWLRKVIASLFPVLKDQARFKAIDLARAANVNVSSRFLIAPSRQITIKRNGRNQEVDAYEPLASGVLGGFGGFLCREFRAHDYQLGRRNCQKFLRDYFVLAADNPLFKNWPARAAQNPDLQIEEGKKTFRPIIPLFGSAKPEVKPLPWPRVGDDVIDQFMHHVRLRGNKLVANITRKELKKRGWVERFAARGGWLLYRSKIFEWIRSRLVADLIRNDRHEDWTFLQDDVDRLIIAALFENPDPRTAGDIGRGINRYCHGRVNWRLLRAKDVSERLKRGNLAGRVIVSRESLAAQGSPSHGLARRE